MNDLFRGWDEYPPTNLLVKAIVEGLGGCKAVAAPEVEMTSEAFEAMQNSAIAAIAAKAGSRLPVVQGRDRGLPNKAPVFDLDELRNRNMTVKAKTVVGDEALV